MDNLGTQHDRQYEDRLRLFELYTQIQVSADTVYHNRTSIITLTQGLFILAYQALLGKGSDGAATVAQGLAVAGLVLSILWFLFEQRNLTYFRGRNAVLLRLEETLEDESQSVGRGFVSFWGAVPRWVKENARWYQRMSAPRIQHGLIPLLFVVAWLALLFGTPAIFSNGDKPLANPLPHPRLVIDPESE